LEAEGLVANGYEGRDRPQENSRVPFGLDYMSCDAKMELEKPENENVRLSKRNLELVKK
jgi:hypothetical protein